MRVILSTELQNDYKNYTVVTSFKAVRDLQEKIEILIIHTFNESEFEVGVFLSELYEASNIEHYICISKVIPTTLKVLLQSVNGTFYDDDFYFNEEEELDALVEEVCDTTENKVSVTKEHIDIIKDFMQGFIKKEARINTPVVLKRTQNAIHELQVLTSQQETNLIEYSETASDIFKQASDIIRRMDIQKKELSRQIEELEQSVNNNVSANNTSVFNSEISYFNSYKYTKTVPPLILIRELVPCRYLTSFILSYAHYLHYEKNRRVKTIIIIPKSHGLYKKFEDFTFIRQDNAQIGSLYDNDTVVVSYPTRDVMRDLTEKPSDIILVIDRLYGKTDIIDGRVNKIYAASSYSDVERFDIDPKLCIFPLYDKPEECLVTLKTIKDFPKDTDARFAAYNKIYNVDTNIYAELDARFGIK